MLSVLTHSRPPPTSSYFFSVFKKVAMAFFTRRQCKRDSSVWSPDGSPWNQEQENDRDCKEQTVKSQGGRMYCEAE